MVILDIGSGAPPHDRSTQIFGRDASCSQAESADVPARLLAANLPASLAHLTSRGVRPSYEVEFDARLALSERVLLPSGPAESHGCSDSSVRIATIELAPLLAELNR
jgi:hypothetical protein